jgi:ABC-type glycerol-3-phosphate transport system substrate-binding protein
MTPGDDTDIAILPARELGFWADRGDLARVPAGLRTMDHFFQWTGVLPVFREQLIEWGGQALAIPLTGDGAVLIYRSDRLADPKFVEAFRARHERRPAPPASWEEFAELAAALTATLGKPALPPVGEDEAAELFFRVAACYDRSASTDPNAQRNALQFQFDLTTGDPRLGSASFVAAAQWFEQLAAAKCIAAASTTTGPAAALASGEASLAVVSLQELGRLPRENGPVPPRFAIAPLPGTRRFALPDGRLVAVATPNYIPYLAAGRIGVVRSRCTHADAAFDLLADLGGPTRSQESMAAPGLGAGPFRVSHLERDRLQIWYGYGFDAERSKHLQDALRQFVRPEVRTPALGLRGPDQEALAKSAGEVLVRLANGKASANDTIDQLIAAWKKIDAPVSKEDRLRWRRMAVGAN